MTAENASASASPQPQLDMFEICRKILEGLLAGKKPQEVQTDLLQMGVPAEDAPELINITVLSAQAASPVIEQRSTPVEAIKSLINQGMEERMATAMVNMIINVMTERATQKVEEQHAESGNQQETINEDTMKIMMRLAQAIAVDLQNGGQPDAMADAIRNIEGIDQYPEIAGREVEFIEEVRLALQAAERARAIPLPQALDQLGIRQRPAYVAVLAVFFMRMRNQGAAQ